MNTKRLLVIGIDTAEYSLIKKWSEDGSLPRLNLLLKDGAFGWLESYAPHLPGANGYSFYLGQSPGTHGLYSHFLWQPEKMKAGPVSPEMFLSPAFWHHFQGRGARGLVINVPNAILTHSFNGIELLSLASDHMMTTPQTNPKRYARKIRSQLRRIHYHEEKYGLVTLAEFLRVRDEMVELTHALKDLTVKMMREEEWDVLVTVLPAVHRAGHRLWSTVNITDIASPVQEEEARDALRQVYIATDQAVAKILEAAGDDCTVLIYSSHGMMHNHSREAILPEMLNRVLDPDQEKVESKGILTWARELIPLSFRHGVKALLPLSLRKRITLFWRLGQIDWRKTRAFVIPLEVRIGIRVNLKGRELKGIVSPGREYDDLCQTIMSELKSFVDADTGKPLIKELALSRDVFDGPKLHQLPDIVGSWNEDSASQHRLIKAPLYGEIPWPTPGHNPEGRSGNHNNQGFLIAYGKEIRKSKIENAHLLDLAPTILSLLGEAIPEQMEGKVLPIANSIDQTQ